MNDSIASALPNPKGTFQSCLLGLLMVFIQFFILPYRVLLNAVHDLAKWGQQRRLPSSDSEFPVLTFVIVDFKPFLIIGITVSALFGAFFTYGASLLFAYFALPFVSYSFEVLALFISAANQLNNLNK